MRMFWGLLDLYSSKAGHMKWMVDQKNPSMFNF